MSLKYHPDKVAKNGLTTQEATEKFQELSSASKELIFSIRKPTGKDDNFFTSGIICYLVVKEVF